MTFLQECGKDIKQSFMDPPDGAVESPVFDALVFRRYLLSLLPPVVGADPDDLETLFGDEFEERVGRFATDAGGVVYVVKMKKESVGYSYSLTPHLTYHESHVTTLALIKRSATLDPLVPLATQLHLLNLFAGDETPYESLHAVVSCGVKPWFDAFVGSRGAARDGGDTKMGSQLCVPHDHR